MMCVLDFGDFVKAIRDSNILRQLAKDLVRNRRNSEWRDRGDAFLVIVAELLRRGENPFEEEFPTSWTRQRYRAQRIVDAIPKGIDEGLKTSKDLKAPELAKPKTALDNMKDCAKAISDIAERKNKEEQTFGWPNILGK